MILQMVKSGMVMDMPLSDKEIKFCESYVLGKNDRNHIQQMLRLQDPRKLESFSIWTYVIQLV